MKPIKDPTLLKPGDPLTSREGYAYTFIAYVPDARENSRLILLRQSNKDIIVRYSNGTVSGGRVGEHAGDVGLPPEKRTVWVNVYMNDEQPWGVVYPTEEKADAAADKAVRAGGKAWPLEIEI